MHCLRCSADFRSVGEPSEGKLNHCIILNPLKPRRNLIIIFRLRKLRSLRIRMQVREYSTNRTYLRVNCGCSHLSLVGTVIGKHSVVHRIRSSSAPLGSPSFFTGRTDRHPGTQPFRLNPSFPFRRTRQFGTSILPVYQIGAHIPTCKQEKTPDFATFYGCPELRIRQYLESGRER